MAVSVEQKVGLFFLMAMIVLGVMIELVEDWRPFEDQYPYRAYFTSAVGLKVGDPVRIAGVEAGKIKAITLDGSRVRVDFYVNDTATMKEDTLAQVSQINLLGGVFLGLDFGSAESPPLPPGSEVRTEEGTSIGDLITNIDRNQDRFLRPLGDLVSDNREPLTQAVNRLEKIIARIDDGDGTLGQLINNPVLYNEVVSLASSMNRLMSKLERGEGTLGQLFSNAELYDNLNQTIANLNSLTVQLRSGQGTFGKLLYDDQLYDEATVALSSFRAVMAKINQGNGTLGKLVNDGVLYDELRDSVARINSIAAKIDNGNGTLGRLINEDTLYRDAETTLHKVEKTVDGMSDTGPISALGVVLGTLF